MLKKLNFISRGRAHFVLRLYLRSRSIIKNLFQDPTVFKGWRVLFLTFWWRLENIVHAGSQKP